MSVDPNSDPTASQDIKPLPSRSNPAIHLRRRPIVATTSPNNQIDQDDQVISNQSQLDTLMTDTSNSLKTLRYPEARQAQPFSISHLDTENEPSQSSTLEKTPSNPNLLASESQNLFESEDSRKVEPTCSDLPMTRKTQPLNENEESEEEPLCRICLGGRDDDDPTLGRFIQPCLCRGTMAFIHVGCLQRWRITSPSLQSFYRCDQCGYRYKLRRAKVAGLAQNKAILGGLTFMIFFILVIVSGFIAGWLLESYSQIVTVDANWDDGLSPFSYDSTGKIVGEVVGEAIRVLNSKLHVDTTTPAGTPPVPRSKFSTQVQSEKQVSKLTAIKSDESEAHSYRYVRAKPGENSHDQSTVPYLTRPNQKSSSENYRYSSPMRSHEDVDQEEAKQDSQAGHILQTIFSGIFLKLEALIKHTIKGLAFIGIMSFFQLAMSVTLFSPWNFGIRNSVLRMMRTGTGGTRTPGGGARPGDPNGMGSLLILLFVLLGVLKAIQSVWKLVRKSSQWALRKIEDGVLDVHAS